MNDERFERWNDHSCKVKEEGCFYIVGKFMKGENCELYQSGKINQGHKEFFARLGKEYPFTEIR